MHSAVPFIAVVKLVKRDSGPTTGLSAIDWPLVLAPVIVSTMMTSLRYGMRINVATIPCCFMDTFYDQFKSTCVCPSAKGSNGGCGLLRLQ